MEKLVIGRQKKREISVSKASDTTPHADLLTAIGLCTMCFMLILSMTPTGEGESAANTPEAVAVMSTAVEVTPDTTEREELVMPEKKASVVREESVFESIGEFFASLIMGEG